MEKENLAIIITGQIRTFFDNADFEKLLLLSQTKYHQIIVVSILNCNDYICNKDKLERFFQNFGCLHQFYNWETDIDEFNHTISEKISNSKYIELKRRYFSTFKHAQNGLNDPDNYIETCSGIQQFQLKKGIQVLTKYISENKIDFDICMRTRYDCKYPTNFFPHFPDETHEEDSDADVRRTEALEDDAVNEVEASDEEEEEEELVEAFDRVKISEVVEEKVEEEAEEEAVEEVEEEEEEVEEEAVEEEEEAVEEVEEEVYEITIKDKKYYTSNETDSIIYSITDDGDIGDEAGVFKNGVAVINI